MTKYVDIFLNLMNHDFLFWFCALSGSGLFLIQLLLSFIGIDDQSDEGVNLDALKITWLSKHAISSFMMMFGWTALACIHEFLLPKSLSIIIGSVAGILTIIISTYIFKSVRKLHSSGSVFRIEDCLGKEATVYQQIPKNGTGKISLNLHDLTYEIDARSSNEEELSSFSLVQIINKADDKTVIVVPIKR